MKIANDSEIVISLLINVGLVLGIMLEELISNLSKNLYMYVHTYICVYDSIYKFIHYITKSLHVVKRLGVFCYVPIKKKIIYIGILSELYKRNNLNRVFFQYSRLNYEYFIF